MLLAILLAILCSVGLFVCLFTSKSVGVSAKPSAHSLVATPWFVYYCVGVGIFWTIFYWGGEIYRWWLGKADAETE